MGIPLKPTSLLAHQLASQGHADLPPLAFIDDEPFLLELQGSLDPPKGEDPALDLGMDGVRVGKLDLENPKKPVLRIAHHRLEGKVEKLATPYALLRTQPKPWTDADSRPTKRARTRSPSPPTSHPLSESHNSKAAASSTTSSSSSTATQRTEIEIVALIRHKIVFSRRPEPLIDVSSEADPTFADRKRAALESNKGVKGPRGMAAAAAAAAAAGPGATVSKEASTAAPAKPKAATGKAAAFFAPRKPAALAQGAAGTNGK
ncbi:hypothetical protein BMF94_0424 [Rhodotorula taiwanensis]|uniref:Uncharacterized protein n=1 Tax=Rhodotorula taiwanensis TaxID=741276 RepID=A0A2S5BHH2_9BASI|nr:hypothetical protein BMF94_0424 [Rhodotorula taiwanensis]